MELAIHIVEFTHAVEPCPWKRIDFVLFTYCIERAISV